MKTSTLLFFANLLVLRAAGAAVEAEPNNTPAQATGLTVNVAMQGQLAIATDQDWFSLWVPQSTTIRLAYKSPADLPSPSWEYHKIRCQNLDGAVLMEFGAAEDKTVDFYLPSEGVFYFIVQKGFDALNTGQYELLISQIGTATEHELNNSRATATAIQQGTETVGQVSSDIDIDWFRFSVGAGGVATFSFDSPSNLPSPSWEYHIIQVTDAGGVVYASVGTASDRQVVVSLPAAGVYYVSISKGRDPLLSDQYRINPISLPMPPDSTELSVLIKPAIEIIWTSRTGHNYVIERSLTLEAPSWLRVAGTIPGNGAQMNYFDTTTGSPRAFYRVIEQ